MFKDLKAYAIKIMEGSLCIPLLIVKGSIALGIFSSYFYCLHDIIRQEKFFCLYGNF